MTIEQAKILADALLVLSELSEPKELLPSAYARDEFTLHDVRNEGFAAAHYMSAKETLSFALIADYAHRDSNLAHHALNLGSVNTESRKYAQERWLEDINAVEAFYGGNLTNA